jgi:hypothetical protein
VLIIIACDRVDPAKSHTALCSFHPLQIIHFLQLSMGSNNTGSLDVLFESHLKDSLSRIKELLPPSQREQLSQSMGRSTVDYSLLLGISKWARSSVGETALRSSSLDPSSFSMISLLSGATTSPNRIFPQYVPPPSQEVVAAERKKERQAITALVNAVLSVGGSGAGAYYASDKTGWKNEWVCNWVPAPATEILIFFLVACSVLSIRGYHSRSSGGSTICSMANSV